MKRANIKDNGLTYQGYIIIETMGDLLNYFNERLRGQVKEAATEIVSRAKARDRNEIVGHTTNAIVHATEITTELNGKGCIWNEAVIMGGLENNFVDYISRGRIIAINPVNGVSHFTLTSTAEYEILSEKDKYTEADIKLLRWKGGVHWYAKIGYIDVVIDGEQKWNTRWIAEKKAKQFLKELNES